MSKRTGFTLIELLIVIAIVAFCVCCYAAGKTSIATGDIILVLLCGAGGLMVGGALFGGSLATLLMAIAGAAMSPLFMF